MRIQIMHTESGPMIGIGGSWANTTAALRIAADINRAVVDAHRTEAVAYRHEATPGYFEYPDPPTYDDACNLEPSSMRAKEKIDE